MNRFDSPLLPTTQGPAAAHEAHKKTRAAVILVGFVAALCLSLPAAVLSALTSQLIHPALRNLVS